MHEWQHARRERDRLRQAQSIADEMRERRIEARSEWIDPPGSHLLVIDFHTRRALHGRAAADALSGWTLPEDVS